MSHQPYETWILESNTLPVEDRRVLETHLATCEHCRALHHKWRVVQQELRMRTMVSPAPGFVQRWQSGLAARRAKEARRQAWKAFLGFMGSAIILLFVLAAYVLSYSSPADWLAAFIRHIAYAMDLTDTLFSLALIWLRSTPPALNLALWIYASVTLGMLSLAWVFALWRTSIIGVFTNEPR